ncbi:hypothetical protein [Halobacillus ihumii]|uniref:hypothetical protein n=1 Tax=Halobacillus ihumii TaxID=2686092 RepID=UPI0013D63A29|nr:hypothetical protein [Halobacillus ihumii]
MDELLYLSVFLIYTIAILILGKHGFDRTDKLKGYFLAGMKKQIFHLLIKGGGRILPMTLGDAYGSINSYLEKAGSFQFHPCFNFIIIS